MYAVCLPCGGRSWREAQWYFWLSPTYRTWTPHTRKHPAHALAWHLQKKNVGVALVLTSRGNRNYRKYCVFIHWHTQNIFCKTPLPLWHYRQVKSIEDILCSTTSSRVFVCQRTWRYITNGLLAWTITHINHLTHQAHKYIWGWKSNVIWK